VCIVPRCIAARRGAAPYKTWAEREVTLSTSHREAQLWARRISRCVSPAWPTSYAHPRRVSLPLPPTDRRCLPFSIPRRIELHGRRSNLQSYARESASAPHGIVSVTSLRGGGGGGGVRAKFAIADNDTERLMAPRRAASLSLAGWHMSTKVVAGSLIN
jgi:hypothetical protein